MIKKILKYGISIFLIILIPGFVFGALQITAPDVPDPLADVLSVGNSTGGTDLQLSGTDKLLGSLGNSVLEFSDTASAVNFLRFSNAAALSGPIITPVGTDTNIDLTIEGKGTGDLLLQSSGGNVNIGGTTNPPLESLYFVGIGRGIGAANNEGQAARWSLTTGSSGPVFKTISNTPMDFETNSLSRMTIEGTGNIGMGGTPDSKLTVIGDTPGSVGGFASGALQLKSPSALINANAAITGHNSFGGNKQLWYLGSLSSSNDAITLINRQNAPINFLTNNINRLTIEDGGNVILENQIQIKGGIPGLNKVLTSDAVGLATWETPSAETLAQTLTAGNTTGGTDIQFSGTDKMLGSLGNAVLQFFDTASAVNFISLTSSATGLAPQLQAIGSDTNIDLEIQGKGTGDLLLQSSGSGKTSVGGGVPDSIFTVIGNTPGTVGGFASGAFQLKSPSTSQFSNAVITLHSSFNTNTQLMYLGSASSSNDNIVLINRQNGSLGFSTNNLQRFLIEAGGKSIFEEQIQIKGGTPGLNKILTSDATGTATWQEPVADLTLKTSAEAPAAVFSGSPDIKNSFWNAVDVQGYVEVVGTVALDKGGIVANFVVPDETITLDKIAVTAKLGVASQNVITIRVKDTGGTLVATSTITAATKTTVTITSFSPAPVLTAEGKIIVEVEGEIDIGENAFLGDVQATFGRF